MYIQRPHASFALGLAVFLALPSACSEPEKEPPNAGADAASTNNNTPDTGGWIPNNETINGHPGRGGPCTTDEECGEYICRNEVCVVPCDAAPLEAVCVNSRTVRYCEAGETVDALCEDQYGGSSCVYFGHGADGCGVPAGSWCELADENIRYVPCVGNAPVCIWTDRENVVCQEDFTETLCDPATFAAHCVGEAFVYRCNVRYNAKQPVALDCAGLGGTCGANGCLIAAGGACTGDQDFQPGDAPAAYCESGLTCNFDSQTEWFGTCE